MDNTRESFVEGVEIREGQDGAPQTLGGYAAVFNQETIIEGNGGTRWRERIAPSAFQEAIGRDDVIAAVNHDPKQLLGRTRSKTLTLSVDEHGLRYSVRLPNTSIAKDAVESIRRGDLTGSSFRFIAAKDGVRVAERGTGMDDLPLLEITKVKLMDVGPVTWPAYEGTSVSMRSVPEEVASVYRERQLEATARKAIEDKKAIDEMVAQLAKAKAWAQ